MLLSPDVLSSPVVLSASEPEAGLPRTFGITISGKENKRSVKTRHADFSGKFPPTPPHNFCTAVLQNTDEDF